MKTKKILSLILVLCLLAGCCACGTPSNGGNANNAGNSSNINIEELSPAEISELAMNNFVKKLQAGNYVVTSTNELVTTAYSPEQVYFSYPHDDYPTIYAYMTLKGETFASKIEGGEMDYVEYVSKDTAVDAVEGLLPNYWLAITGGNMFEFFYNDPEKPLEFTTNDENVKYTLGCLAGLSQEALELMGEVRMALDAADPASVHFTAPMQQAGMYHYDDLDVTIKFGEAKSEPVIDAWFASPVYPKVRTAWTKNDISDLDHVFMRDYGKEAVPFPGIASYAMTFDKNAYKETSGMILTDAHLTEKDVEDYKELLKKNGFTETDGTRLDNTEAKVYRKAIREEYGAYSQLYVAYDDGLLVEGMLYYECPEFDGREAISEEIQRHGYSALPETDVFTGWHAWDTAGPQTEAWSYNFDYNFFMIIDLQYQDRDAAIAYLSAYVDQMIRDGYKEIYTTGADNRGAGSTNQYLMFYYQIPDVEDDTGIARLWFKDQKSLTVEEVLAMIKEHGLPETDIHGDIAAKDIARYYYEIVGFEGVRLLVYQPYDSIKEAEDYLDSYAPGLVDQGYLMVDPEKVGSARQFCFLNEDLRKLVGFDITPTEEGAQILFELVSFEEEEESLVTKILTSR